MTAPRPEILAYHEHGEEDGRLAHRGHNRLELARTQDLLARLLPPAPANVLDVGGGSGVYAEWLAGPRVRGHGGGRVRPSRLEREPSLLEVSRKRLSPAGTA